jgi:hypothetical protein
MKSATRSWAVSAVFAAAFLVSLGTAGCGLTREEEDCFQLLGELAQVTSDTFTVDHYDARLSPRGDVALFTTDAWVEEFETLKQSGERDVALIELPVPGEVRRPVASLHDVGKTKRVVIDELRSDNRAVTFPTIDRNKGELSWHPDGEQFFLVIENNNRRDRIYQLRLVATGDPKTIRAQSVQMIDDVGLATASLDNYYYRGPAVSPDGRWLAYSRYFFRAGNQAAGIPEISVQPAIFAYDLQSDPASPLIVRVTAGASIEQDPTWSPDGNWIAFVSNGGRVGTEEIYKIRFDPGNAAVEGQPDGRVQLTSSTSADELKLPTESFNPFWMRNGRIVFTSTRRPPCSSERRRNVWSMDADGGNLQLVVLSREDDHFVGGSNFTTNVSAADNTFIFSSRRNPVVEFNGQKDDLYLLRGGF